MENDSLSGHLENESVESTQRMDITPADPVEAANAAEDDVQATDQLEREIAPSRVPHPEEESSTDEASPPLGDHLQSLYDTYHASYAFPISETSAHMQHAKDLASTLLQRHFPTSKGFVVEPAALGPYSAKGVNFLLKEVDEPDSDPDTTPRKKRKRNKRAAVLHSSEPAWHFIEPEYMAAFEVKKGFTTVHDGVESTTYRTHTSLVIILDDLATFQRWSRANVNHRGDVLSDILGVRGQLERCYGMLLFGPRLELYNYYAGDTHQPVKPYPYEDWRMDMRTTSLAAVDAVLHGFVEHAVTYQEESLE